MKIYYIDINNFNKDDLALFKEYLLVLDYIGSNPIHRQKEKILGYILCKYILWHKYKLQPSELTHNSYGKPHYKDCNIHFNISHSNNLLFVAFDKAEVGIDIEYIKMRNIYSISARYFTVTEQEVLQYSQDPLSTFYKIWTLKESYTKYLGTSLGENLHGFDSSDYINAINKVCASNEKIIFNSFKIGSDLVVATCSEHKLDIVNIEYIKPEMLYEYIKPVI